MNRLYPRLWLNIASIVKIAVRKKYFVLGSFINL